MVEGIEDFGGDSRVEPLNDGEIVLDPLGIVGARDAGGGYMGAEVAATNMKIEEMPPVVVIVGGEIKNNGDERADIDDGVREGDWRGGDEGRGGIGVGKEG